MRFSALRRVILPAVLVLVSGACNDEPDFRFGEWEVAEESDSVTLYTVDRLEHQSLPGAYDAFGLRSIRIEDPGATGAWDFALTGGAGGPLTLSPLGAFFDVASSAGINTVDETFDELERAPTAEDAYITDESIALEMGSVYVIRTRANGNCIRFAKLEPIEIDATAGSFTFRLTRNPNCNNADLVPPED